MAEGTALVGLQAQVPDVLGRLSQLLTLQQQKQQVRGATAEASSAEQSQRQRESLAKYDWNRHIGEDGTLDLNTANDPELMAAAGDQYQQVLHNMITAKSSQLEAKSKLVTLRNDQRQAFGDIMTALRSDTDVSEDNEKGRQKVNEAMIQYGQMYGEDVLPVLSAYAGPLQKAPKGRMADALRAIGLQTESASAQIALQNPTYLSTGSKLTDVNPNSAGTFPDLQLSLPPGAVLTTDANGRQFFVNPQAPGNAHPVGGGGTQPGPTSPDAAPSQPTFVQPVPGQKDLEAHISDVRKADSDYGTNRHVNDELLRLSSDTSTGPGTALWHTGAIGKITGTFGGNPAADYQKIGAYLDRQAALASSQMGLPETNAGLATAANLSGTTEYVPDALQTKVKLTDALVEGAHQYRQGLDKVIGTGPNQNLSQLQTYRAQWADNFDPNIFRAERAIARGDKKELAALREELGTRGMADLKRKSDNLEKLSNGELLK